jgi:hypothetical protein
MNHNRGTRQRIVVLLIVASLLGLLAPIGAAQADVGPKPSMSFEFVYQTEEPLTIVDGEQMQCEEPDCADAEPLEDLGPQRLRCTATSCSSTAYGYTTYNQLVVKFSDGVTRTSGVFSGGTMRNEYRVTVREDDLQVEHVRSGRAGWPILWAFLAGLIGTPLLILLGLALLVTGVWYGLSAWKQE